MTTATMTGLSVRREAFAEALGKLTPARSSNLPILTTALVETTAEGVRLTATDLDVRTIVSVPCEAEPGLRLAVPHRTLHDAVARLRSEVLHIEMEDSGVTLDGSVRILGMDADEFPPEADEERGEAWTTEDLVGAIREAAPYASSDTARPILNGIYLDPERGNVVALDGHNILIRRIDKQVAPSALLPKHAGAALAGMMDGGVWVRTGGGFCRFDSDGGTLIARLLQGTYPDYTKVALEPDRAVVECDRAELLRLVELAELVSNREQALGGSFIATISADSIEIHSEHADTGHANLALDADVTGADIEIKWGCGYVKRALKTLGGERVRVAMDTPERVAKWTDPTDDARAIWIMPRRILG